MGPRKWPSPPDPSRVHRSRAAACHNCPDNRLPGGSVAAPTSPNSEDDVTMQEANHNDAALTLLSLFGQCSLQDVDGDEEEGQDITDGLTWGDDDDHMNEAEFEEAEM